jgi:poly-gamma-glutamate synthesis protein (capsule biosynthesis protein)
MSKVGPDMQNVLAKVREARNKADVVVVSCHWGEEYQAEPTARQKALGHATIDAGADVVLGHHPHVMSGLEQYGNGLIVYSMGNFVFDQRDAPDGRMTSAIFRLEVRPRERIDLTIIPIRIPSPEYAPRPAGQEQASQVLVNLARRSEELGTGLRIEGQRARATFTLGAKAGTGATVSGQPAPVTKGDTE